MNKKKNCKKYQQFYIEKDRGNISKLIRKVYVYVCLLDFIND